MLGLTSGGQAIYQVRVKFIKFLKILVTIASLQTQFVTLDEALKMTNRRVNALEFVLIPRIAEIIDYIKQELDEIDREDFVRLKKTQDKKKEKKAKQKSQAEKESGAKEDAEVDSDDEVVIPKVI